MIVEVTMGSYYLCLGNRQFSSSSIKAKGKLFERPTAAERKSRSPAGTAYSNRYRTGGGWIASKEGEPSLVKDLLLVDATSATRELENQETRTCFFHPLSFQAATSLQSLFFIRLPPYVASLPCQLYKRTDHLLSLVSTRLAWLPYECLTTPKTSSPYKHTKASHCLTVYDDILCSGDYGTSALSVFFSCLSSIFFLFRYI